MELPPGVRYLAQQCHNIFAPPACVFVLNSICQIYLHVEAPRWVLAVIYLLSFPIALTVTVLYGDYRIHRMAAACGAVVPVDLGDGSLGRIKTILAMSRSYEDRYLGEGMATDDVYTWNFRILFQNRIFTAEPQYIKTILTTQSDNYEKGSATRSLLQSLLGTGVFNSDGDMWKFHRVMTRPFFSRERIGDFDNFDRHATEALDRAQARLREGFAIDFQDVVQRFTLDSASEFLLGHDVRSLSADLPYPFYSSLARGLGDSTHPADIFANAFAEGQNICAVRLRYGSSWPLFEFWRDRTKKHMDTIYKFINPILVEAVRTKRATRDIGEHVDKDLQNWRVKEGETLLEHLVDYTEDITILRDEVLNVLIAGRDTVSSSASNDQGRPTEVVTKTASTLTFAVYMLAEHPDVLKRLREEISNKLGSTRRPTFDDFKQMKFLRAVINETLRLYPTVPFNVRMSKEAVTWPSLVPGGKPYYIPAHTSIPFSMFLMQRRTDLWGPDALAFDPDRFIDERLSKYLTPNPFIFLPFNAGPRICLGQQFAYNEASFFLVRLLQRFSTITLAPEAQPPSSKPPARWANGVGTMAKEKIRPKAHLTLYVSEGLWLKLGV